MIVFRVDASQTIGMGHVMRCLSLADTLKSRGQQTYFVSIDLPNFLINRLKLSGHELILLPRSIEGDEAADAEATKQATLNASHYVVDHYELGQVWESYFTANSSVLAIDDLQRPHAAQWVLDQSFGAGELSQTNSEKKHKNHLLYGPRYALLRDEFITAHEQAKVRAGKVSNVVISIGGTDALNVTEVALRAAAISVDPTVSINVVVGEDHPALQILQQLCMDRKNTTLYVQPPEMAPLFLAADLAIGGGGISTLERCACGLPSIAICVADNQANVISEGGKGGFLWGFLAVPSRDELASVIKTLSNAPDMLHHMSSQALRVTDAKGTHRVSSFLIPPLIELRDVGLGDSDLIFRWRSAPEVTTASRDQKTIDFDSHTAWFERALKDPDKLLMVGMVHGTDFGVVRFDVSNNSARISIFLSADFVGKRLGPALLTAAERHLREVRGEVDSIEALVNADNFRSECMFISCGYSLRAKCFVKDLS